MTPLFKKLNLKDQETVVVINSPSSFEAELAEISKSTQIVKDTTKVLLIDFALIFVLSPEQIDNSIELIFPKLQGDTTLWFCYPKRTSKKYKCEINRDNGWETIGKYNLEGVRLVAIDEDWSALRFRKTEYIKSFTRKESHAISQDGKERAKNQESKGT